MSDTGRISLTSNAVETKAVSVRVINI
jgi:hypothetical protein